MGCSEIRIAQAGRAHHVVFETPGVIYVVLWLRKEDKNGVIGNAEIDRPNAPFCRYSENVSRVV